MSGHFRTTARAAALALALAGAIVAVAPAASATVVDRVNFTFTEEETFDDCGFPIHVVSEFSFRGLVTEVNQSGGQAFNLHQRVIIHETHTNLETSRSFTVDAHLLQQEIQPTHVEGNIWQWTFKEAGVPFQIKDESGKTVLRDRGVVRYTEVADTLGDGQIGAEEISFEVARISGPHPGMDEGFDFCAVAEELTT